MKSRRVVLTIELETDIPVKELKSEIVSFFDFSDVPGLTGKLKLVQVQANVIKQEGK